MTDIVVSELDMDKLSGLPGIVIYIAKEGDTVEIENFEFRVIEVDNARIVKLKIRRLEPVDTEDKDSAES